jgi:hypothetical protein
MVLCLINTFATLTLNKMNDNAEPTTKFAYCSTFGFHPKKSTPSV